MQNWRPKNGSIPDNKKEEAIWKGMTHKQMDRQTESLVDNNKTHRLGVEINIIG